MAYDSTGVFKKAIELLNGDHSRSIKALSEVLGVERHTLEKCFQLNTGMSFRMYRREQMSATLIRLLASKPTASLKEIAFLLGYRSERAFARFVRVQFSCCPRELRSWLMISGQRARSSPKQEKRNAHLPAPSVSAGVRTRVA